MVRFVEVRDVQLLFVSTCVPKAVSRQLGRAPCPVGAVVAGPCEAAV